MITMQSWMFLSTRRCEPAFWGSIPFWGWLTWALVALIASAARWFHYRLCACPAPSTHLSGRLFPVGGWNSEAEKAAMFKEALA